jgi:hypothetical protein
MRVKSIAVLPAAFILALTFLHPAAAGAGVHVNIGINLPAFVFPEPPSVVVIPGTYVYFAPEADVDVFFYHGYWYRPHERRWFRARSYNGPWGFVSPQAVPPPVMHLPPDYRHARRVYDPVPYGQLRKNWRTWEREKHWGRHDAPHYGRRSYEESRARDRHDRRHDEYHGHERRMERRID